jgi:hypothetical protein
VVGLQALSQYSIVTYSPEIDLEVTFFADQMVWRREVTQENAIVQQIISRVRHILKIESGLLVYCIKSNSLASSRSTNYTNGKA